MGYKDYLFFIQSKLWRICSIKKNEKYQKRNCHQGSLIQHATTY